MTKNDAPRLHTTTSRDGTEIGFWTSGHGPPLLLVHGSLGDHTRWDALRPHLEPFVTLHALDRRGRGVSGDAPDYTIERETDDVAAAIDAIADLSGSAVDVYCSSYGGVCAFGAPALTSNLRRLALYEAWPAPDPSAFGAPTQLLATIEGLLEEGQRESALTLAYRELAGVSDEELERIRAQPSWPNRIAAAHTVPREMRAFDAYALDPAQAARIRVPTLLLVGSESRPWRDDAETVAAALPDARIEMLAGHGHAADVIAPEAVAEPLLAFLRATD